MTLKYIFNARCLKEIIAVYNGDILINPLYVPIFLMNTDQSVYLVSDMPSGTMVTEYMYAGGNFGEFKKVNLNTGYRVKRTSYSLDDFLINKVAPATREKIWIRSGFGKYIFYVKLPEHIQEAFNKIWGDKK